MGHNVPARRCLQTLLANTLDAAILPEAHILCDLMASYKRAKNSRKKTRYFYAARPDLLTFFQLLRRIAISPISPRRLDFATALVLKDPNFVQFDTRKPQRCCRKLFASP